MSKTTHVEGETTQEKEDREMEETRGNEEINIAIDVHDDNVAGGNDVIEGYQLVDCSEDDSDYESDYDSDGTEQNISLRRLRITKTYWS